MPEHWAQLGLMRKSLSCGATWTPKPNPYSPTHSAQPIHPNPINPTQPQAIARMLRALDETVITGVPTTGPFHKLILKNESFVAGDVDTGFIPKHIDTLQEPPPTPK